MYYLKLSVYATPCFTYESEDGPQNATLKKYVMQKMTPRTPKANQATEAAREEPLEVVV